MGLDVEVPDPPSLRGPQPEEDYDAVDEPDDWPGDDSTREALGVYLRDGAWEDAFADWSEETYLSEEEFRLVADMGLIEEFDFYWNRSAEDVGYRAPTLDDPPEEYRDRLADADVDGIEEELDALGRTVSEVLENDYIHRGSEEFGYSWE